MQSARRSPRNIGTVAKVKKKKTKKKDIGSLAPEGVREFLDADDMEDSGDGEGNMYASTKLLEKRKEMLQVENMIEIKQQEFEAQMDKIREKEKVVLQQRNELTENIISLDKYIKVRRSSEFHMRER